ncbi:MAG: hypothetical protein HQL17_03300 [Candidatus Omnitrophica bacterium]|nr:hypothetical protein [Candidatus Omnitrophota bacterium]
MIRGITPIDAAFEMMGLHQAQALTHFIFSETWGGRIIFTLGFILSLGAGLEEGNFKSAMKFVFMFLVLWLLLVVPSVRSASAVSAMERSGYQTLKAADILRKNGYDQVMVNPILDAAVRWMDSLISGATAVFDRIGNGRGYLSSPFLMVKTSLLASHILSQGITDPLLQTRTAYFYQDHFWPALHIKEQPHGAWPGDAGLSGLYKEEGRQAWTQLRDDLYVMVDQDGIMTRMFEKFYEGKVDKDAIVRDLLAYEMSLRPGLYTRMTYGSGVVDEGAVRDHGTTMALGILAAMPFVQGCAIFLILAAFPFCLALALLWRLGELLWIWAGVLFSVKVWTLAWAVTDKLSWSWFEMSRSWHGSLLWQIDYINITVVAGSILSAVAISAGLVLTLHKIQRGGSQ